MNNLLRLSGIQALLPSLVMVALPAGASAQPRLMGPRMGNPGMAGAPGWSRPFNFGATSPVTTPRMTTAMQSMSTAGGGTSTMAFGRNGMAPSDMQAYGARDGSADPQAYGAEPQHSGQKRMSRLLTASGVPNDNGRLRWPLGLVILAAPGLDELCDHIDTLFAEAAGQAAGGPVSPALAEETRQAVMKLRRMLLKEKAERFGMPLAVYQESERYLNRLDQAEQLLRAGMKGSSTSDSTASWLLTASGVPNDNGRLRWPLGLAILAAPGADELCEQIEALFEEAAGQAAGGPVNPTVAEEARQAVRKLRRLLLKEKAERFGMPLAVYQESERFLDKLDRTEQFLRAGMKTPGGQPRLKTEGSSTSGWTGSYR